jgi:peptide/nickel transport system substrate-binding protein
MRERWNVRIGVGLALAIVLATGLVAPADAGKRDLVVLLHSQFGHLDPSELQTSDQGMVMTLIYSYLFRLNKDAVPVPDLVESEKLDRDQVTWTFGLRKGVTFHDGTPVNAEAVKYTIERMLDPERKAPQAVLYAAIKEVRVLGEHTVQVITKYPFPALRYNFAHSNGVIVSPTADRKLGKDFGRKPVGSGPFKVAEWIAGQRLVLQRNDAAPGPKPYWDTITFKLVPDAVTRELQVEKGEADVALRISPQDAPRLANKKDVKLLVAEGARNAFLQLNLRKPPTDDVRVRQALNYAVDKEAIIKVVLNGAGVLSRTVLEKPLLGSKALGPYPFDPKKARQLLKEAGAEGATIDIISSQGQHIQDAATSEAVANYLRAVGLKVNLRPMGDQPAYIDQMRKGEHNAAFIAWSFGTFDPDQILRRLFYGETAGKPWNFGGFKDEAVDGLIDRAGRTLDVDARRALYEEIQEKIFAKVPWIFLHRLNGLSLVRADIENLNVIAGVEILQLADARRAN